MQDLEGIVVYSASDLVGYLECEHLTSLERAAVGKLVLRPTREDPELEVLQQRGLEHERRYLTSLQEEGRIVVDGRHPADATPDASRLERIQRDAERTRHRMDAGADVIYQATLFGGGWLGYADFLLCAPWASALGDYHSEVADTKLARRVKGGALLQILYSLNRLKVATSRGRRLALVVASPALLKVRVHTPVQMRMANALCRFAEVSTAQADATG